MISRRADQFANGVSPVYAQQAKGSRFIDIDENEYIDWVNAVGAVILGHADDVVDGAVVEQIRRGSIYTLNSLLEIELAEELVETIPSAEMVRYTKGGGEACAVAMRIARGVTGRDKVLICGYHGWHDWYQAANFGVDPESGEYPFAGIEPIGVPKALAGTVIPFVYGDTEMLASLLDEHAGDVAAIMMEPARSELPPDGYLESVQALAKEHDVVLIFDEVSSGWRYRIGGIQAGGRRHAGHDGGRQGHVQRLCHGRGRGLAGGDGAGQPHVHLQLLLERQHRVGRGADDHSRTETTRCRGPLS